MLSHGGARNASARVWVTAAVCLALGALAGVQVDDALDDRRAARERASAAPTVSAGVIQESPDPGGGPRFVVPIHNGGAAEITVDHVAAPGWVVGDARFGAVTIPPHGWAVVPLPVQVDCAASGAAAPERLTVRSTTAHGTFEQDVAMPASSPVLTAEASRLCVEPSGTAPGGREVVGTWVVEEAGAQRGTLFRLRGDGTFAIDPDLFRFGPGLDALGTFTGAGPALRLTAAAGHACRPGDRTTWRLTLLEDGRLHVRHRPDDVRWCDIEDGEVWVARRVPEP